MRSAGLLAIVGGVAQVGHAAATTTPRGVGPEFAKFYEDTKSFQCISVPSIHISSSQVNDDYCDCPDGSDEPGTAACSYLSPLSPPTPPHPNATAQASGTVISANALPGFYCQNKGHNPAYLRFSHVNDGVCDYSVCCDGSDEWARVGGVSCPDKCKEIGKEWRKADEARRKSHEAALQKRRDLVQAATAKKTEVEARVASSTKEVERLQNEVSRVEKEKEEIETREAARVVKGGKGGKTGILAELAKGRLAELRVALTRVKAQRDAYARRTSQLEGLLTTFKEEYNPNFNDEGVKRAVRSWDDYAATDKEDTFTSGTPEERDLLAMLIGPESDEIDWDEFTAGDETAADDDIAALYNLSSYLPPSLREWLGAQMASLRALLVSNGILSSGGGASGDSTRPESKAVRDAKARLTEAQNELRKAERGKTDAEAELKGDYGRDEVFRTLKGSCVSLDSGEYTYELCWLDRVQQRSQKGGAAQNMGRFEAFEVEDAERGDAPPDGRGLGSGPRLAMRYAGGSHCWNGPARSTLVVLGCAEVEAVWRVAEEEKCVYRMEVGTPAVCTADGVSPLADAAAAAAPSDAGGGGGAGVKDEL